MRHRLRPTWVAFAALLNFTTPACGSSDQDSADPTSVASTTTTEEATVTTTEPVPVLHEASTAQYQRSDGVSWTATLFVGDDDKTPASLPKHCDFAGGRDAAVPIKLQIASSTRARTLARLVLNTSRSATGHLQANLGLRSDQRILLDVTNSPEGSSCIDLTYAGYSQWPEFGIGGNDATVELEGQLVLVGYLDNKGIVDLAILDALVFRWLQTGGPPPNYQITEGSRNFNVKLVSVTSVRPLDGVAGSPAFSLLT